MTEPENQSKRSWQQAAPVVALLVACIGIYLVIYLPFASGSFYSHLDTKAQFIPWRCSYSLALEKSELAIWNPFLCRGYPNLAEGQSGVLHPAHILAYRFLPVAIAAGLEMGLYIPFAFLGMFLLLRLSFRRTSFASVAGAGLFSFSSFFLMHYMHVNMCWVYAHLPWALLCLSQLVTRQRGRRTSAWLLGLVVCLASAILLGHPQTVWFIAIACTFLLVFLGMKSRFTAAYLRRAGIALGAMLAALLIGMIQILPTADLLSQSERRDVSKSDFENYSWPPVNAALNLSPYVYDAPFVADTVVSEKDSRYIPSPEFPNYFGLGTILVIGTIALLRPRGKSVTMLVLIGLAVGLLLMFGRYGGLIHVQRLLPLVSKFRCPVRYGTLLFCLSACLLAWALDALKELPKPSGGRLSVFFVFPALSLLATLVLRFTRFGIADTPVRHAGIPYAFYGPLAMTLLSALLYFTLRYRSRLLMCCLALLALADAAAYNLPLLRAQEKRSFAGIQATRSKMDTTPHTFRHYAAINDPVLDGHYLATGYLGMAPRQKLQYNKPGMARELLLAHIRLGSVAVGHFENNGIPNTIQVPDPLPRLRLARELKLSEAPLADDLSTIDLTETALTKSQSALEKGPPLSPDEQVIFLEDGFGRVTIQVNVKAPRVLVLSDRWWPHWHAQVDGQAREIIPLFDETMRGVIVEPGDKVVEMQYRSAPLRHGIYCAIAGVLLAAGLAFLVGRLLKDCSGANTGPHVQCSTT